MGSFILTKKLINNIFIVNIYVRSGNIAKYIIFRNTLLMEMIANTSAGGAIITIKIYISKKRSSYRQIINSLMEMLVDFKRIIVVKL
jgi:hypothetical protein